MTALRDLLTNRLRGNGGQRGAGALAQDVLDVLSGAAVARGWFCPECRRLFSTPITTEDGCRWHNRACGTPMVRALVVER